MSQHCMQGFSPPPPAQQHSTDHSPPPAAAACPPAVLPCLPAEIWLNSIRYAMIDQLKHPRPGFEEVVTGGARGAGRGASSTTRSSSTDVARAGRPRRSPAARRRQA